MRYPQRHRQPQGEQPDRRKLHPRPIVQIAGVAQFLRPCIEGGEAGASFNGGSIAFGEQPVTAQRLARLRQLGQMRRPQRRPLLQPALPIGPPAHLGDELLGVGQRVHRQHRGDHLFLAQQPPPQRGGQAGDMAMTAPPLIEIAPLGIGTPRQRHELVEPLERLGAG